MVTSMPLVTTAFSSLTEEEFNAAVLCVAVNAERGRIPDCTQLHRVSIN